MRCTGTYLNHTDTSPPRNFRWALLHTIIRFRFAFTFFDRFSTSLLTHNSLASKAYHYSSLNIHPTGVQHFLQWRFPSPEELYKLFLVLHNVQLRSTTPFQDPDDPPPFLVHPSSDAIPSSIAPHSVPCEALPGLRCLETGSGNFSADAECKWTGGGEGEEGGGKEFETAVLLSVFWGFLVSWFFGENARCWMMDIENFCLISNFLFVKIHAPKIAPLKMKKKSFFNAYSSVSAKKIK